MGEREQAALQRLSDSERIGARHSQEYQDLLYGTSPTDEAPDERSEQETQRSEQETQRSEQETQRSEQETQPTQQAVHADSGGNPDDAPTVDPAASADAEDSTQ